MSPAPPERHLQQLYPSGLPDSLRALGSPRGSYGFQHSFSFGNWSLAAILLLIGGAAALMVVVLVFKGTHGSFRERFIASTVPVVFSLLFLNSGLYFFKQARGNTAQRLFLFDEGLLHLNTDTRTLTVMRWEAVSTLYTRMSGPLVLLHWNRHSLKKPHLVLQDDQGASLELTWIFSEIDEIAGFVQEEVTRRQVARMLENLADGQELSFGRLRLSSQGLALDDRPLRWDEVRSVDGLIHIEKKGQPLLTWGHINVAHVPNARAFVQLCQMYLPEAK